MYASEIEVLERAIDLLAEAKEVSGREWQTDYGDILVALGSLTRLVRRRRRLLPKSEQK